MVHHVLATASALGARQAVLITGHGADVVEFDLLKESPPPADLILCLWVLNHFNLESCRQALANLKASGSKYLMMTDRPIWHHEQPPEIVMEYVEELKLNEKGDRIILCPL